MDAASEPIALYLPPSGDGDTPLTDFAERAWRSRVAWGPQDAYVFDSSLHGNLRPSRSRADAPDEAAMDDSLRRAGLGPLLDSLPDGLDTGAGGSAPSGGERQRDDRPEDDVLVRLA